MGCFSKAWSSDLSRVAFTHRRSFSIVRNMEVDLCNNKTKLRLRIANTRACSPISRI